MKQIIKILEEMGIALTPAQKKELTEKGSNQMRSAADYTALEQQLAANRWRSSRMPIINSWPG